MFIQGDHLDGYHLDSYSHFKKLIGLGIRTRDSGIATQVKRHKKKRKMNGI